MRRNLLILTIFLLAIEVPFAEELITPNYQVTIEWHCDEGNVICDNVTYTGKNRKTGDSIKLKGSTWHKLCADGVTPCRFLGYKFQNGNTEYIVYEDGLLEVLNTDKVLLREKGNWN